MYSPKISEDLVPILYRLRKEQKMPMTRLVDKIIRNALASDSLPKVNAEIPATEICVQPNEPRNAVA